MGWLTVVFFVGCALVILAIKDTEDAGPLAWLFFRIVDRESAPEGSRNRLAPYFKCINVAYLVLGIAMVFFSFIVSFKLAFSTPVETTKEKIVSVTDITYVSEVKVSKGDSIIIVGEDEPQKLVTYDVTIIKRIKVILWWEEKTKDTTKEFQIHEGTKAILT